MDLPGSRTWRGNTRSALESSQLAFHGIAVKLFVGMHKKQISGNCLFAWAGRCSPNSAAVTECMAVNIESLPAYLGYLEARSSRFS